MCLQVHTEERTLAGQAKYELKLSYQAFVAHELIAVVTTDRDAADLQIGYYKFGSFKDEDCANSDLCSISSDGKSIMFLQEPIPVRTKYYLLNFNF